MVPRNPVHIGPDGRGFFGTVTVGQRGQVAIPAQARKNLGLESGDQLVVGCKRRMDGRRTGSEANPGRRRMRRRRSCARRWT